MAKLPVEKLGSEASKKAVPVRIVNDGPVEAKSDEARERKWRAESALNDIERAEQHKTDLNLMKEVKALARKKVKDLKKIC